MANERTRSAQSRSRTLGLVVAALCAGSFPATAEDFSGLNEIAPSAGLALKTRPLFDPDRRPPPPAPVITRIEPAPPPPQPPPPPPSPPTMDGWSLVGVVRSGGNDLAIIKDAGNGEVYRLRSGEIRKGWKLVEINRRSARFVHGGTTGVLSLPEAGTE